MPPLEILYPLFIDFQPLKRIGRACKTWSPGTKCKWLMGVKAKQQTDGSRNEEREENQVEDTWKPPCPVWQVGSGELIAKVTGKAESYPSQVLGYQTEEVSTKLTFVRRREEPLRLSSVFQLSGIYSSKMQQSYGFRSWRYLAWFMV